MSFAPLLGAHWLRPQVSSRYPNRFTFFDTEAISRRATWGEEQSWRLGVVGTIKWSKDHKRWGQLELTRHKEPESLWEHITQFAAKDCRTILVAHNINYDLRISRAFEQLDRLGWQIDRPTVGPQGLSFEAVKGTRKIITVDSYSLLPVSLQQLAIALDMHKPELPLDDENTEAWWERCEADVRILAKAYMAIIDWLRTEDLGGWARTGPALGWKVMLRRHLHDEVLVHANPEVRDAEAAANYGGRVEVWSWGPQRGGPHREFDFTQQYATICATCELPAKLQYRVLRPKESTVLALKPGTQYLVFAQVETEVPVLPWRHPEGIIWPIGSFSGWWWDIELAAAMAEGAKVKPLAAWAYLSRPWLRSFGNWVLETSQQVEGPDVAIRAIAVKQWGRTVPGRTHMRFSNWRYQGEAYEPGVRLEEGIHIDSHARWRTLTLGNRRWESYEEKWAFDALPQVLSYVTAASRVRLWEVMKTAGLEDIVYVDTDCVIANRRGESRLIGAIGAGHLLGLRPKNSYPAITPWAPHWVEGTNFRKMPGVPVKRRQLDNGEFVAEVWDGMLASLKEGAVNTVKVRWAKVEPSRYDPRRLHLLGGATAPLKVEGNVIITPPPKER